MWDDIKTRMKSNLRAIVWKDRIYIDILTMTNTYSISRRA